MKQSADSSDLLIAGLRRGDTAALQQAMQRYGRLVASVIASLIPDRRDVEELTQDVFIRAFSAIGSYRPGDTKLTTWLARIAFHAAVDSLRRSGIRFAEEQVDTLTDIPADDAEPSIDAAYLAEAMRRLSPQERLPLTLVYFDDLSVEDAAAVLGLTPSALSSRLYRIRKKLASLINEIKQRN